MIKPRLIVRSALISLCTLSLASLALGMAGVSNVAEVGRPAAISAAWPMGVELIVNDPRRTRGWNPFFTELPNDMNYYEFKIDRPEDLNGLVDKLASIQTDGRLQLFLSPEKRVRMGFGAMSDEKEPGTSVVFAIGDQKILEAWYERLPKNDRGVRQFGVGEYTEPPKAMPPSLIVAVAHPEIDLAALKVPSRVTVLADVPDAYRKEHADDPVVRQIDAFVAEHTKEQPTTAPSP